MEDRLTMFEGKTIVRCQFACCFLLMQAIPNMHLLYASDMLQSLTLSVWCRDTVGFHSFFLLKTAACCTCKKKDQQKSKKHLKYSNRDQHRETEKIETAKV